MKKELDRNNEPQLKLDVLGKMDVSSFRTRVRSKREMPILEKSLLPIYRNIYSIEEIDEATRVVEEWGSDGIFEGETNTDSEFENVVTLYTDVALPLYSIIYRIMSCEKLSIFADDIKGCNTPYLMNDISSEEVYNFLIKQKNKEEVYRLLYHYYPSINEFETLKRLYTLNDKDGFCDNIAMYNRREIYEFCLYYRSLKNEFKNITRHFQLTSKEEVMIYINGGVLKPHLICKMNQTNGTLNLLKCGKEWIRPRLKWRNESIETLEERAIDMISFLSKLHLDNVCSSDYESIKQSAKAAHLFKYALNPDTRYKYLDLLYGDDNTKNPKVSILNPVLDTDTQLAITKLIVDLFLSEGMSRKGQDRRKVTSMAQKSVVKLLSETSCLNPAIKVTNNSEVHSVMTQFIDKEVGYNNVGYNKDYIDTEIFQNINKKECRVTSSIYKQIGIFEKFMIAYREIINKN